MSPRISLRVKASISVVRPQWRALLQAGSRFSSSGDLFLTFLCAVASDTKGVSGGSSILNVLWLTLGQN